MDVFLSPSKQNTSSGGPPKLAKQELAAAELMEMYMIQEYQHIKRHKHIQKGQSHIFI